MSHKTPSTMSVAETVDYLVEALGGRADTWATWLSNDRRSSRTQQLPFEAGLGRPRYDRQVVDAFIDKRRADVQRDRSATLEISALKSQYGTSGANSRPGRQFSPMIMAMTSEDEGFEGEEPYVMLVTASPLALFQLNAVEARRIAARLISAADRIEQSGRSAKG